MSGSKGRNRILISQKFAIGVITTLFSGTALGWLLTEVFPADFQSAIESYRAQWGDLPVRLSVWLKLFDPFRSFWYTSILVLFFIVLFLCIVTRWKQFVTRSFRIDIPGDTARLDANEDNAVIDWSEPAGRPERDTDPLSHFARKHGTRAGVDRDRMERLFSAAASVFSRRRFSVARSTGTDRIVFRAVAGRLRHMGNLIFHVGLLVITAGGMVGSMLGSSEFFYGARGDLIPVAGEESFIRVDDFRIIMGESGMVKDYISRLSVVDSSGTVLRTEEIEVNKPMSLGNRNIYQSSYTIGEGYEWIRLAVSLDGSALPEDIMLKPGERARIGQSSWDVVAGRFFPDFRMSRSGPYSASPQMANPAVSVHLVSPGDTIPGYLFLRYPRFNSKFGDEVSLVLRDLEPAYYTGLEIATNPGAGLMMGGMFISALGLILLYMFNYRMISGYLDADRLVMCAEGARLSVTARSEFEKMEKELRESAARILAES